MFNESFDCKEGFKNLIFHSLTESKPALFYATLTLNCEAVLDYCHFLFSPFWIIIVILWKMWQYKTFKAASSCFYLNLFWENGRWKEFSFLLFVIKTSNRNYKVSQKNGSILWIIVKHGNIFATPCRHGNIESQLYYNWLACHPW